MIGLAQKAFCGYGRIGQSHECTWNLGHTYVWTGSLYRRADIEEMISKQSSQQHGHEVFRRPLNFRAPGVTFLEGQLTVVLPKHLVGARRAKVEVYCNEIKKTNRLL